MKIKLGIIATLIVVFALALSVTGVSLGRSMTATQAVQFSSTQQLHRIQLHSAQSLFSPFSGSGPLTGCTFQTLVGYYLTAVGGGGRTTDVIHTNATVAQAWEKFDVIPLAFNDYAIRTVTGNYLTAVGEGGRETDVIHSNATVAQAWETFHLILLNGNLFAIQTVDGHYLTAVGEGGRTTDTIHSDATRVQAWEEFTFTCGH